MRFLLVLSVFLNVYMTFGQYHFSGNVGQESSGKTVYLSLVEDYRKSSRIYLDQIIGKVKIDSLGYFQFHGNNLLTDNRIYRIHLDGCAENSDAKHFLGECDTSKSVLFIANNKDTLQFPTSFENQTLCTIIATNPKSSVFLEIDALKEEMIFDFADHSSKANELLNFRKWFKKLQHFGEQTEEPLAELLIYDFLSDRKNETHAYYLENLESSTYYDELQSRLHKKYPTASFTEQYQNELWADKQIIERNSKKESGFKPMYFLYILLGLLLVQACYYLLKNRKRKIKKKAVDILTPQEFKIFNAIREGKTNKEIATSLFISLSTVKTHVNNIYKKLNLETRKDLK